MIPFSLSFEFLALVGLLFGVGLGFCAQKSGLCYAHGLGEIFMGKGKRIIRIFLVMLIITSIGFLLSSYVSSTLGLKAVGQIRGYGFYNILSGIFFGAGILSIIVSNKVAALLNLLLYDGPINRVPLLGKLKFPALFTKPPSHKPVIVPFTLIETLFLPPSLGAVTSLLN